MACGRIDRRGRGGWVIRMEWNGRFEARGYEKYGGEGWGRVPSWCRLCIDIDADLCAGAEGKGELEVGVGWGWVDGMKAKRPVLDIP